MKKRKNKGWAYLFLMMMLIGFTLTLIGCKGKHTMTESVKTEYVDRYIHDTIRIKNMTNVIDSMRHSVSVERRDCVVIIQDTAGNVINTSRWHFHDTDEELTYERIKLDSEAYFRSIIDSLRRVNKGFDYTEKVLEKKLSTWQQIKINLGGYAIVIVFAILIYLTWHVKRKDRQNI